MTLLYLTLAWTGGILLCHLLRSHGVIACTAPGWPPVAAAGAIVVILILLRRSARTRLALGLALFFILGVWRYQAIPFASCPTPEETAFYNNADQQGPSAVVQGLIVGYPDVRDVYASYRLRVDSLTLARQTRPVHGDILVQTARFPTYRYGDRLRVTGRLQEPPVFDDFDYRAYLARGGIHSLMRQARVELLVSSQGSPFWAALYGLRARGATLLDRVLPEPTASLANGMLLGIEGGIPPEVYDAYRATGTAHVIVISGSNVALLAGILVFMLAPLLGRRRAVWFAIVGVLLYVLLSGAEPPALRAGLMATLFLLAVAIGRQSTAWVSLVAAALFMTLLNPLTLWDVGFQLSFMATLGLILFTPPMTAAFERWLRGRPISDKARQALRMPAAVLIVTLAAQITTTPLLAHYFGQLSLVSLPANLLILPAQPPIMAGGMATLAAGLIWEPLGRVLAALPWLALSYTNAVVRLAASVPYATIHLGMSSGLPVLLYYAALFGVFAARLLGQHLPNLARGLLPASLVPATAGRAVAWATIAAVPVWLGFSLLRSMPDGKLHVIYLPSRPNSESEITLVITPRGQRIWVGDWRGSDDDLASLSRSWHAWQPKDTDTVISPREAGQVWPSAQRIDPAQLAPGSVIRTADGITLTRLDAGESWAFALDYGRFRTVLLTSLAADDQTSLASAPADLLRVTVLKLPGLERETQLEPTFLAAMAPQVLLWSQGAGQSPDVMAVPGGRTTALVPAGAAVEVVADGERMWLHQWSQEGTR